MDSILIDYLKSGKAWLLIGSGPSIEMGYPTWRKLAEDAIQLVRTEASSENINPLENCFDAADFPSVFERAKSIVGGPRLIQYLDQRLRPVNSGEIYKILAKWPIPVYLTTNFDEEIQKKLAELGEAYRTYDNTEDSLAQALPDLTGAIFKLHGDLKSERGLILTTQQYKEIGEGDQWQYWRTKLTSIFQMKPVVIIGYSINDPNIKHVLHAAKEGAGVAQPICWITSDVDLEERKKYLEDYRIRLVPYDNKSGDHRNLSSLLNHLDKFVPPRTAVHIKSRISEICQKSSESDAGAVGFFVYNRLETSKAIEKKRIDITLAAIQAILPKLSKSKDFELREVLEYAGWPKEISLDVDFISTLGENAVKEGLLEQVGEKYRLSRTVDKTTALDKKKFAHVRERFIQSLILRLKRSYSQLSNEDTKAIAADMESSLIGYFRENGLTLATTLFSTGGEQTLPSTIVEFLTDASARYDDYLKRQAFCTVLLDAFINSESAERDYLGRLSQGFFAFHALGVFGDVAGERLRQAINTVWLVDSSAQIPAAALAAPTCSSFRRCFSALSNLGVRLFTTERLFDETLGHLNFAQRVIEQYGCDSPYVIAAAEGDTPYHKSNQFMQGFIRWQASGNACDWDAYMFTTFQHTDPDAESVRDALERIGIEIVPYEGWPGFHDHDFADRRACIQTIVEKWRSFPWGQEHGESEANRKALPEAEALIIIKNERHGDYYILADKGQRSQSWFISNTSILNLIEPGMRITWQPEAFIKFSATLSPPHSDDAFETILWNIAESGLNILENKSVVQAFGGIIDQSTIDMAEEGQIYEKNLAEKYGESPDAILSRIPLSRRPMAGLQLARQAALIATAKQAQLEQEVSHLKTEQSQATKDLKGFDKYKRKQAAKRARALKNKRKAASKRKKRK